MKSFVSGIVFAALFTASSAQAALTTYTFEASVTELTYWNDRYGMVEGPLPGTVVSLGDILEGRFSVDTDLLPAGPTALPWNRLLPVVDFGYAIPSRGIAQSVNYSLLSILHPEIVGDSVQLISYESDGPRFMLQLGSDLQSSQQGFVFDIRHFPDQHEFTMSWFLPGAGGQYTLRADLFALHEQSAAAQVPEPASLGLMALTGLALGATRLRRKNRDRA